jgi:3-deoxy-D-manno-octulosonic-acid transferase
VSAIFVYRLLQVLGFPFIVVYFLLRAIRDHRYLGTLGERLGFLPASFRETAAGAVWLHAVSVGEVLSSVELVRRLRAELPMARVYVSTATLAGRSVAEERLRGLAAGVFYAPLDYCFAVRRVLRALRPRLVVVMETEIWPNLYREAKRAGCGLVIVNGRISDRAMPRYRRLARFFSQILGLADAILVQTAVSLERYLELGAPAVRTRLAGNLKYDFAPKQAQVPAAIEDLIACVKPAEVWIAASTMPPAEPGDPDEDDAVIGAFGELAAAHPGLLLILAPRRPERFDTAAGKLAQAGVPFVRRSELTPGGSVALPGVLLLDSIGELSSLFGLAQVVFMGGTLAHRGGHNILEPAFFARPVIIGPHMENFPEIAAAFRAVGAVLEVEAPSGLVRAVGTLLANPPQRERIGTAARTIAESERGATGRAVDELRDQYWRALPVPKRPAPLDLLLWPLARLWAVGAAVKTARDLSRQATLDTPVISVGGLAVGGTGKSPLVLWLAQRLSERGYRPSILTRGYRRQSGPPQTVLGPGETAPIAVTGDEAQVYVRVGLGPVGIGAGRAAAGRLIEQQYHPGVFILDDGFQHHRLARCLDIVTLDALDPFAGGDVLPRGRLREGPSGLGRAGLVLVTRLAKGGRADALVAAVRLHNPSVPLFTSCVVPEPLEIQGRAGAFCGLGNPEAFWQTLEQAGVHPEFLRAFADHHRYTREELRALARDVDVLVTTEKDFMNLPEGWSDAIAPVCLVEVKIRIEIDQEEEFLAVVEACLSSASRNCLRSSPPP